MINFLLIMVLPVVVAIVALLAFKGKVTLGEFAALIIVPAVLVGISLGCAYEGSVADVEILNGQVTSKARVVVPCEHSYPCNCHEVCSGYGKNETCSMYCDTCYEHPYDVDWNVYSNIGKSVSIDRVDRQGLIEPTRWDAAFAGEPFSLTHHYTNYIKANPHSVLLGSRGDMKKFGPMIPAYPITVYDYYKHNPVINEGVPMETAQVPTMYTDDMVKVWHATMSDRYGANGSQAVLQFIKESNPNIDAALYKQVQEQVESFHDTFEASQTDITARKQAYQKYLTSTTSGRFYNIFGHYPRIHCGVPSGQPDDYAIVTSDKTETDFKTHKAGALKLRP